MQCRSNHVSDINYLLSPKDVFCTHSCQVDTVNAQFTSRPVFPCKNVGASYAVNWSSKNRPKNNIVLPIKVLQIILSSSSMWRKRRRRSGCRISCRNSEKSFHCGLTWRLLRGILRETVLLLQNAMLGVYIKIRDRWDSVDTFFSSRFLVTYN